MRWTCGSSVLHPLQLLASGGGSSGGSGDAPGQARRGRGTYPGAAITGDDASEGERGEFVEQEVVAPVGAVARAWEA